MLATSVGIRRFPKDAKQLVQPVMPAASFGALALSIRHARDLALQNRPIAIDSWSCL
jgi:hypothetical protein